MDEEDDYERVFSFDPNFTYDQSSIRDIVRNRQSLGNTLFFDRLLQLLNIKQGSKIYPPRTNEDLRTLYQKITASEAPEHHKQSLLYYVFLDCDETAAGQYAEDHFLPEKYRLYMCGLWHMDRLNFEEALIYLTKPSLVPTFPDEILSTLVKHAPHGDMTLPLVYFHTVNPQLASSTSLDTLFSALCHVSVSDAFYFARSLSENAHQHLFERLLHFTLSQRTGEARAEQCVELVNLPFSISEEQWFEDYLLHGKGKALHGAKDTLMMRRLGTGQFKEALEGSRGAVGREASGLRWNTLSAGIEHGLGFR